MSTQTINELSLLFRHLTSENSEEGFLPFRWQKRLLNDLINNRIPSTIDIPTGLGKTSVMALWLLARSENSKLPRRLVWVVDRRAVVDQASRFADQLSRNLPTELANKLGLNDGKLPISTLRGNFADNRKWLEDPSQPAIIVGTVDMIGSRLLFCGYGVSSRMRPYYAGLLGSDVLYVLDEAHLCPSFEKLLRKVADIQNENKMSNNALSSQKFRLISLSATSRSMHRQSDVVFSLTDDDLKEPVICQRLHSKKILRIQNIEKHTEFVDKVTMSTLKRIIADSSIVESCRSVAEWKKAVKNNSEILKSRKVVVFCNSRKDAINVKKKIENAVKGPKAKVFAYSELLVGERRVFERTKIDEWLLSNGFLGSGRSDSVEPRILIATSAGEVGVDIDADDCVCDLVSYERMMQRFGRVNRRGGNHRLANIDVIVVSKPKVNKVFTEELFEKWKIALDLLADLDEGEKEANPYSLTKVRQNYPDEVDAATTLAPLYPELNSALLDAWSLTNLTNHTGRPEVSPWLRGWIDDESQTTVVWRKFLPEFIHGSEYLKPTQSQVNQFFSLAPIHLLEKLDAPSSNVADWFVKC